MLGLDRTTWQGLMVLFVAMAASLVWNQVTTLLDDDDFVDPHVHHLVQLARSSGSESPEDRSLLDYHDDLQTTGHRRQTAVRPIPARTTILTLPRHELIWDLDAFRNSFVQQELVDARLVPTDGSFEPIPLTADVFLAAHLARLIHYATQELETSSDDHDVHGLDGHPQSVPNQKNKKPNFDDLGYSDRPAASTKKPAMSDFMKQYLARVLPRHEDYVAFHPIYWNDTQAMALRKASLATYDMVNYHRELITNSYHALTRVSMRFEQDVSYTEFATALLHVWTRSFGTGPPLASTLQTNNQDTNPSSETLEEENDELEWIRQVSGVDLSKGSFSMVPILDLYNHHANPNVEFQYDAQTQVFRVSTIRTLATGQEVRDSYGKHTEAHLLAKYGFVNGDGSDHSQASLALFHPVYSRGLPWHVMDPDDVDPTREERIQAQRMIKYLHNDDGYDFCIQSPATTVTNEKEDGGTAVDPTEMEAAFEFKKLKLRHLMQVAKIPKRWMMFLSPRNPPATPPLNHTSVSASLLTKIPHFVSSQVKVDANPIMATCRLIAMTHHDYNETATRLLRTNLGSSSSPFHAPPTKKDALQYREIMCILRLCKMAFDVYKTTVEEQTKLVRSLNLQKHTMEQQQAEDDEDVNVDRSLEQEWMMAHVQLAELQGLEVLRDNAMRWMKHFLQPEYQDPNALLNSAPEYTLRNAPCPWKYQLQLLETL